MQDTIIKRENYITIQGWMITDLKLKGNELLIYAIIYGFSQTDNQWFTGSRKYLAEWTNSTKQGIQKCLNSLVDKELLIKQEEYINGIKFCKYRTNLGGGQQSCLPSQQSLPGWSTKLPGGGQQSCPNNIDNNIDYNNKTSSRKKTTNATSKFRNFEEREYTEEFYKKMIDA